MKNIAKFDVRCVPPSKKNSWGVQLIGGRPRIGPTTSYKRTTVEAVKQIAHQVLYGSYADEDIGVEDPNVPITFSVEMTCLFHVLYKSTARNSPDLPNLLDAPADWLQPPKFNKKGLISTPGANVLADDRLIRSVDGSRIIFECDDCCGRKPGCNYRFEPRLKKNGAPWLNRRGVPIRDKIQLCQRGRIEIELKAWAHENAV